MTTHPKLTLRHCETLGDWYVIERAEHDGRQWLEPTEYGAKLMCSARISDADVEGDRLEMLAIAEAIRARRTAYFKRCAVAVTGDTVSFWSPRNSTVRGVTSYEHALELAEQIETPLKGEA